MFGASPLSHGFADGPPVRGGARRSQTVTRKRRKGSAAAQKRDPTQLGFSFASTDRGYQRSPIAVVTTVSGCRPIRVRIDFRVAAPFGLKRRSKNVAEEEVEPLEGGRAVIPPPPVISIKS